MVTRTIKAEITPNNVEQTPHLCWISYRSLATGVSSGTVIFAPKEYKHAGGYEVRFFQGDTRNGAGYVCKGLKGSDAVTDIQCQLEAALVSSEINIYANNDMLDDLDAIPGMEAYFDSDRGRFKKDYSDQ